MQKLNERLSSKEKQIIAFIALSAIYFVSGTGAIMGSNDGGHFALIKAIVNKGHFYYPIDNFIGYIIFIP